MFTLKAGGAIFVVTRSGQESFFLVVRFSYGAAATNDPPPQVWGPVGRGFLSNRHLFAHRCLHIIIAK